MDAKIQKPDYWQLFRKPIELVLLLVLQKMNIPSEIYSDRRGPSITIGRLPTIEREGEEKHILINKWHNILPQLTFYDPACSAGDDHHFCSVEASKAAYESHITCLKWYSYAAPTDGPRWRNREGRSYDERPKTLFEGEEKTVKAWLLPRSFVHCLTRRNTTRGNVGY